MNFKKIFPIACGVVGLSTMLCAVEDGSYKTLAGFAPAKANTAVYVDFDKLMDNEFVAEIETLPEFQKIAEDGKTLHEQYKKSGMSLLIFGLLEDNANPNDSANGALLYAPADVSIDDIAKNLAEFAAGVAASQQQKAMAQLPESMKAQLAEQNIDFKVEKITINNLPAIRLTSTQDNGELLITNLEKNLYYISIDSEAGVQMYLLSKHGLRGQLNNRMNNYVDKNYAMFMTMIPPLNNEDKMEAVEGFLNFKNSKQVQLLCSLAFADKATAQVNLQQFQGMFMMMTMMLQGSEPELGNLIQKLVKINQNDTKIDIDFTATVADVKKLTELGKNMAEKQLQQQPNQLPVIQQ